MKEKIGEIIVKIGNKETKIMEITIPSWSEKETEEEIVEKVMNWEEPQKKTIDDGISQEDFAILYASSRVRKVIMALYDLHTKGTEIVEEKSILIPMKEIMKETELAARTISKRMEKINVQTDTIKTNKGEFLILPRDFFNREIKESPINLSNLPVEPVIEDKDLRPPEVAKRLNKAPSTVYYYIKEGKLPATEERGVCNSRYYVKEKDLIAFMKTM